jgi:fructose-bisphosphate aldolase class II
MPIVNINEMLKKALEEHYAVLHANVVNYDMAKAVILAAQEVKSPIIVAVSEKALKGFVSPKDFVELVKNIVYQSHITVPVAMHLDHGEYETVISAMESGFTSVMYDGSKLPIKTNIQNTNEIVSLAHAKNISVECEVGTITGKKEDQGAEGQLANVMDAQLMAKTGIDALAAGIGNLHGEYPQD